MGKRHDCTFGCDNYCSAIVCINCGTYNEGTKYDFCVDCSVRLQEKNRVGNGKGEIEEDPIDLIPLVKNVLRSEAVSIATILANENNVPYFIAQLHDRNKWDVLDRDPMYLGDRNPYAAWICLSHTKIKLESIDPKHLPEIKKARRWAETDDNRPTWDELFMEMAVLAKKRSTCLSRQVGAVIVVEKNVVSIGYNGSPPNMPHCINEGCRLEHGKCVRSTHAEQNALIQAAKKGTATAGATLYSTWRPCDTCAKLLPGAGIARVVYLEGEVDGQIKEIFDANGIEYERLVL